jgi:hypothetical protein
MRRYRIIADLEHTFRAELVHADGRVETAQGFPNREAALAWVGERLVVEQDQPDQKPD